MVNHKNGDAVRKLSDFVRFQFSVGSLAKQYQLNCQLVIPWYDKPMRWPTMVQHSKQSKLADLSGGAPTSTYWQALCWSFAIPGYRNDPRRYSEAIPEWNIFHRILFTPWLYAFVDTYPYIGISVGYLYGAWGWPCIMRFNRCRLMLFSHFASLVWNVLVKFHVLIILRGQSECTPEMNENFHP